MNCRTLSIDSLFQPVFDGNCRLPFEALFGATRPQTVRGSELAVNVADDGERFIAEAEIPGLGMEDLDLSVIGNKLSIKAEQRVTHPEDARFLKRERMPRRINRVISLPLEIDTEHVEAKLENGVLTVLLPKAAAAKPRKIAVKQS